MEKPIVFLSHSSKNKTELTELKLLLDKRAAGSLDFFLSSDGQSIRFGRNWVVRISDALSQAKLMFVFLSPESADSKWIHFEAGCAYAKDIQVIPVCLPGMDFSRVIPPLGLLQGFNLHSYEAFGNIARTCNEVFQLKMDEKFTREEFESVFFNSTSTENLFFGKSTWFIENIFVKSEIIVLPANENFDPLPKLMEIINEAGLEAVMRVGTDNYSRWMKQVELPGCVVSLTKTHETPVRQNPNTTPVVPQKHFEITSSISPELFHLNASLLDKWYVSAGFSHVDSTSVRFEREILAEETRPRLTTKLHKSGVKLVENLQFDFEGLSFCFLKKPYLTHNEHSWSLDFQSKGNLFDNRLPRLVDRLFASEVFFERPPYLEL